MENSIQRILLQFRISLLILIGFASCGDLFKKYAYSAHHIPSGGMEPTLQIGDYVFSKRFALKPKRGDIILHKRISADNDSEKEFVKRLIGLPGDRILYEYIPSADKTHWILQLYVNGKKLPLQISKEPLDQENYDLIIDGLKIYYEELDGARYKVFSGTKQTYGSHYPQNKEFLLGPDEFFALGDNRFDSYDSRWIGPIKREHISGIFSSKYFSINWKDYTCKEILENIERNEFDLGEKCPRDFISRFARSKIRWGNIGQTDKE